MNPVNGQAPSAQPPQPTFLGRHGRTLLASFLTLVVLVGATFSITSVLTQRNAAHATSPGLAGNISTYQNNAQQQFYVVAPQQSRANARLRSFAAVSSVPVFNNVGISTKSDTTAANIDGGGYSYSYDALIAANIEPNLPFVYDGIRFSWPNVNNQTNPTQADNWQAAGQVLPLQPGDTSEQMLGFIGAATGGAVSGNAVVTYSDGTTVNIPLGLSDWTLGGGTKSPAYGNRIVSAEAVRNGKTGVQNVKTYLFYTSFALATGKTPVSVQLPTLRGGSQLHIFAYGLRSTSYQNPNPYNSTGMSDDAYPSAGNFDGGGNSYSAGAMPWGAGYTIYYNQNLAGAYNMNFQWPDVLPGSPDNYLANGQTIPVTPVAHATKLGFVGAATGGATSGTGTIIYTDGNQVSFKLGFSDWTLDGYTQPPSFNNRYFAGMSYRNTHTGQQNVKTFLFYTEVDVDPNQTIQSIILPTYNANSGHIHVYSIATGQAGFYENVGVSGDNGPAFGNYDGGGNSYSGNALQNAGITFSTATSQHPFTINGTSFTLMYGGGLFPDNWAANGQIIPVNNVANATALAFLGSATGGMSTGYGTIYYTDGTSQSYTLTFSDWCSFSPASYNYIVANMPYRNTVYGRQNIKNYLYEVEVPLKVGKTVSSVQLPSSVPGWGKMHVFAAAEHAGNLNNVGITDDKSTSIGAFDGNNGNSYSAQALQSAGLVAGKNFSYNGYNFPWPAAGTLDNYLADGQTVPVTAPAGSKSLALLGSSSNGLAGGSLIIRYTDGTFQQDALKFLDWCNSYSPNSAPTIVATMSYRNTHTGQQTVKNYIYLQEVALDPTKTVLNITLPEAGSLHVFSYAFK